jgi:hypothetical protein
MHEEDEKRFLVTVIKVRQADRQKEQTNDRQTIDMVL